MTFRNKLIFYGEGLIAPRPTPKLEDHPLSAIRDCLFNIFAASLLYNIKAGGNYSNRPALWLVNQVHTVKEAKSQRPSVDILPPHIHHIQ
jgi:hypothetical protein